MAITASVIDRVSVQADGRKWVHEIHTDNLGLTWTRDWLAQAADDLNAALSAHAAVIANDLINAELAADLAAIEANGSLATGITTSYATLAQVRAALRTAYASATQTQAIMLGDYLSSLADATLQTLFSMTAGQVTTLRTNKLTPAASAAATIRAASGA